MSGARIIYLLEGYESDYEYSRQWVIRAYTSVEPAEAEAQRLNDVVKKHEDAKRALGDKHEAAKHAAAEQSNQEIEDMAYDRYIKGLERLKKRTARQLVDPSFEGYHTPSYSVQPTELV